MLILFTNAVHTLLMPSSCHSDDQMCCIILRLHSLKPQAAVELPMVVRLVVGKIEKLCEKLVVALFRRPNLRLEPLARYLPPCSATHASICWTHLADSVNLVKARLPPDMVLLSKLGTCWPRA